MLSNLKVVVLCVMFVNKYRLVHVTLKNVSWATLYSEFFSMPTK